MIAFTVRCRKCAWMRSASLTVMFLPDGLPPRSALSCSVTVLSSSPVHSCPCLLPVPPPAGEPSTPIPPAPAAPAPSKPIGEDCPVE